MKVTNSIEGSDTALEGDLVHDALILFDGRLRFVQESVDNLAQAMDIADVEGRPHINQTDLFNFHTSSLKVQVSAARFETQIATDNALSTGVDLNSLYRSIKAIFNIVQDLKQAIIAFEKRVTAHVASAAETVIRAGERAFQGFRAVVRVLRRKVFELLKERERGYLALL
jgi:hypothetical protein